MKVTALETPQIEIAESAIHDDFEMDQIHEELASEIQPTPSDAGGSEDRSQTRDGLMRLKDFLRFQKRKAKPPNDPIKSPTTARALAAYVHTRDLALGVLATGQLLDRRQ